MSRQGGTFRTPQVPKIRRSKSNEHNKRKSLDSNMVFSEIFYIIHFCILFLLKSSSFSSSFEQSRDSEASFTSNSTSASRESLGKSTLENFSYLFIQTLRAWQESLVTWWIPALTKTPFPRYSSMSPDFSYVIFSVNKTRFASIQWSQTMQKCRQEWIEFWTSRIKTPKRFSWV